MKDLAIALETRQRWAGARQRLELKALLKVE